MRGRLYRSLLAMSLAACAAIVLMWVWSYWSSLSIGWESRIHEQGTIFHEQYDLFAVRGSIGLASSKIWFHADPATMRLNASPRTGLFARRGDASWPARWSSSWWRRRGFVLEAVSVPETVYSYLRAAVPAWVALLPSAALPLFAGYRRFDGARRLRRSRAGRCGPCGYDLRASAGRCPECGALPSVGATAA